MPGSATFHLRVDVDEVSLTLQAADAHGLPINDLRLDEVGLLDNGKPPRKILAFQALRDVRIRGGILMDVSDSMQASAAVDLEIAVRYAQHLLRRSTDQAFVMKFRAEPKVGQDWTGDPAVLSAALRNHIRTTEPGLFHQRGTALFDALYRACSEQFGKVDAASSANFILLFSDGEDNVSRKTLKQALGACQHASTAIYSFRADARSSFTDGPKVLEEMAAQTGGRVFRENESDAELEDDLRTIEADLHNGYRIVYRPAALKQDGAFHSIAVTTSDRVDRVRTESGYYAPMH